MCLSDINKVITFSQGSDQGAKLIVSLGEKDVLLLLLLLLPTFLPPN